MKYVLQRLQSLMFVSLFALTASAASYASPQSDGQQSFASPGQAVHALITAVKADNQSELQRLFGPDGDTLISSGDSQQDAQDRQNFIKNYEQAHRMVKEPGGNVTLYLGAANWPFPIPLVEKNGSWVFDTDAGKQEILYRRIGKNELSAIEVCQQLVAAEKEHYQGVHAGEAGQYARYFVAQNDDMDGLYHPSDPGRPEIGPLLAQAGAGSSGEHTPFHGYLYRILDAQGPNASGGAKSYIVDGKMTGGVAFVAYPAAYGSTGVETFIVNQDGAVYEKNLGPDTTKAAAAMTAYDPDSSWKKAE